MCAAANCDGSRQEQFFMALLQNSVEAEEIFA
jgi:hypothetical protein